MVNHDTDNPAMVWGSSDKLTVPANPSDTKSPAVPANPSDTKSPAVPANPSDTKSPVVPANPSDTKSPAVPANPSDTKNLELGLPHGGGDEAVHGVGQMQRPKHPTSYFETLANHQKVNIATGMYAMGDAFKNGGYLLSPILTVCLGIICIFNQHALINCANVMRERNNLNYYLSFDDTVEQCFASGPESIRKYAKLARSSINFFLISGYVGFCCVYMVLVTSTTHQIIHHFGYDVDFHLMMVLTLMAIIGFILIRNLKYIAPVSLFATITMITGLGLTLFLSSDNFPPLSSRNAVASLGQLPLFFGTVIYAYEGIGVVLPLQREMKNPEKFSSVTGVLNVGNAIVTTLLLVVGSIGYLKYGEEVQGSLSLNLPQDSPLSQCVKIAVAIGVLLTYPIIFYVPVAHIWPVVVERWGPFDSPAKYEYILRISLCLLTFVLGELVPNLSVFISLLGAVNSTALALVFPPLCDLAMRHRDCDFGALGWRRVVDYLTLVLAAFGFCTGTYFSLQEIVHSFGKAE